MQIPIGTRCSSAVIEAANWTDRYPLVLDHQTSRASMSSYRAARIASSSAEKSAQDRQGQR